MKRYLWVVEIQNEEGEWFPAFTSNSEEDANTDAGFVIKSVDANRVWRVVKYTPAE
jgi:hypothetical protein